MRLISIVFLLFLVVSSEGKSVYNDEPQKSFSVSGYVKDAATGEVLIAASVYIKELGSGTVTNPYGFYSIGLNKGSYTIGVSYIGYNTFEQILDLNSDLILNIELKPEARQLEEVVISSVKKNNNVSSLETGTSQLQIE